MVGKEFTQQIEYIVAQLRDAEYEPYNQLIGYAKTGIFNYITRRGNARVCIERSLNVLIVKNGLTM